MLKQLRIDVAAVSSLIRQHCPLHVPSNVQITFRGVDFGKDVLLFDIEHKSITEDVEIQYPEGEEEDD